ncbi:MAG: SCP2 sterol-binding domain-containing protein [Ruminococcus sp.]|nr:SCP2 sterol-binding domain-containing protein [Ruminococcus sp.]
MTYEEIVSEVKKVCDGKILNNYSDHLAVEVNITGEGEGVFYIEAKDGVLHAEPYNYYDRDARFNISAKNFLKLAEGKLDPVWAFTSGKLKIDGSIEKALEFKNVLDMVR